MIARWREKRVMILFPKKKYYTISQRIQQNHQWLLGATEELKEDRINLHSGE